MSKLNRWSLSNFFRSFSGNEVWAGDDNVLDRSGSEPIYDWLDSRLIDSILNLPEEGRIICHERAYRPDLLSLDIYQSMEYWQVLLIYNNLMSVEDLTPDKEISYPSREKLEITLLKNENPENTEIPQYWYDSEGNYVKVN
ncbi:hypothetical protein [Vibrio phage Va2]|nr:hypothetical protein [Vibrio phage Va2]